MRTIILGGGVIGVTTAWYLAEAGHEVTVIERRDNVARETSYANAGLIAPGHSYAWASPSAPMVLLKSLYRDDTSLRLRLRFDPRLWAWGVRFLANCSAERNRHNTTVKVRLCAYSRDELARLRERTGIAYDENTRGTLYLYRDREQYKTSLANMALLNDHGLGMTATDPDGVVALEPALHTIRDKLAGAIHAPKDESGDCRLFTERLAEMARARGVLFRFETNVTGLSHDGERIQAVTTDRGPFVADNYVLALGSYSPLIGRPAGVKLPIYPVKGYSVTVSTEGHDGAPAIGGIDEHHLVAFARFGDRLRLTSTAEFAGYDTEFDAKNFGTILRVARELFPRGGDYERPNYWACLRPSTPDGPPIIGRSPFKNLWLNTGHGHIGWTMACGSGRAVADLMLGNKPEIDVGPYSFARY